MFYCLVHNCNLSTWNFVLLVTFWNTRRANLLVAVGAEKNPRSSVFTLSFQFSFQLKDLFKTVVCGELFDTTGRERVSRATTGAGKFLSISWKDDNGFTLMFFKNLFRVTSMHNENCCNRPGQANQVWKPVKLLLGLLGLLTSYWTILGY